MSDTPLEDLDFFPDPVLADAFQREFLKAAANRKRERSKYLMSTNNLIRVRHGTTWLSPAATSARNSEMQMHSACMEVSFSEVANHDLDAINRGIVKLADSMAAQLAAMAYNFIEEVCDETGNVVQGSPGLPFHEAFYQAIEKIEYTIGRDGQVHRPDVHIPRDMLERIKASAEEAPPEFHERMEALHAVKDAEAWEREHARRARFRKFGASE